MRLHHRWALLLLVAAAAAAPVPDLLWGLAVLAALVAGATVSAPRGVGRRLFPLAAITVALAAVEGIRLHGLPGL